MEIQKRAVIYCRVSTKEQVEEGNSLATQEKKCKEYALKYGYEIAQVFIEQGESAKTADRTELKKLLSFCANKKHNIRAIIAYKIDRISRNIDDYSQIRIQLRRYGVEIKSTSENFENNPTGRFMENIIANVAQFDNDVRAERCIGGMIEAVREGRYVWQAPAGYDNVRINGKATIAPNDKSGLIVKAFESIAAQTATVEELRHILAVQGLTGRQGGPITKSHFYRILQNEIYTGWISQFGERNCGTFSPIITEELFAKVQTIIHRSSSLKITKRAYKSMHTDFPLKTLFRDIHGNALIGYWGQGKRKKYPYYILRKAGINIRKEILEGYFKQWLENFKLDSSAFHMFESSYRKYVAQWDSFANNNADRLKEEKQALLKRQDILINKNIDGVIDDALCKEKLYEIKAQLFDIDTAIEKSKNSGINSTEMLAVLKSVLLRPAETWERASFEDKQNLQRFYFPHGMTITKQGSRTPKICSIFKAKATFDYHFSSKVNLRKPMSNTKNLQNLLIEENDPYTATPKSISEFFSDASIQGEFAQLATILKDDNLKDLYKA